MRQDDEKRRQEEKVRLFAQAVYATAARLELDEISFINALLNMTGYALPSEIDEEYLRDVCREIYKLFIFINEDKRRHTNEHL